MAADTQRDIPLANIRPDLQNPRHDLAADQREAIHQMVVDQGEKLLKLAEHIVTHGLNPTELLIVIPDPTDTSAGASEVFVVLEGNRRVTALKLLEHPDLLSASVTPAVRKKYGALSKEYAKAPITSMPCAIFADRDSASRWIQLRHTGENQGVGVVSWGAKEQERFRAGLGTHSAPLKVIDFMRERGGLSPSVRAKLKNVSITNLERLLNDPDVRQALGVEIRQGMVTAVLPEKEVTKGLRKVLTDLATEAINVNTIRTKTDRKTYLSGLASTERPDTSKFVSPWSIEAGTAGPVGKPVASKPGTRSTPLAISRKVLIPRSPAIAISDVRVNAIYHELGKLKVEDFPNAAAIMLRVFFELSVDHYIDAKGLAGTVTQRDTLSKKVSKVADDLEANGALTKHQLKPVRTALSHPDDLFSIDTLHAFVHNRTYQPMEKELKTVWDRMRPFMEALWA
jgi:hypothetical protein